MACPAFSASSPLPKPAEDRAFTVTPSTSSSHRRKPGPEPALARTDFRSEVRIGLLSSPGAFRHLGMNARTFHFITVLDADAAASAGGASKLGPGRRPKPKRLNTWRGLANAIMFPRGKGPDRDLPRQGQCSPRTFSSA